MTAQSEAGNPSSLQNHTKSVLAIAGPTCSGKSALAAAFAEQAGGVVINADSMQVYRELRILTARPTEAEEAAVPHRLYGTRPAAEPGNAAWWSACAHAEINAAHQAGLLPILCGGTGLYFEALRTGLANIPDPGEEARDEARTLLRVLGPENLHARLAEADPETASALRSSDSQRIARAWEVWRGTGRGLAAWTQRHNAQEQPWTWQAVLLEPPRDELRSAIRLRFAAMLEEGAIEEVRSLLAQKLDPALPAMRAHGVPELAAVLRSEITLSEAARLATLATGQYTKRQTTWFRHHTLAPGQLTLPDRVAAADAHQVAHDCIQRFECNAL